MEKILSLCFPTYNRGWCMKNQIERLRKCPLEILDKIEILISDNCSTDDTQEIVKNAISQGFICSYIRNERNLGMDGNFVNCFRFASGHYVWLLGDDDIIIPSALSDLVLFLEQNRDLGLIHLAIGSNSREFCFKIFNDKDSLCKSISYWFSYISSNISQTKYVRDVPFEKYMGTWFTLIPQYFASLAGEKRNAILEYKVLEDGQDTKRNGGYNFFEVFVRNYLNIMYGFTEKGIIKLETYQFMKKDIYVRWIVPHIDLLLIRKRASNMRCDGALSVILKYYYNEFYFYYTPLLLCKRYMNALFRKITR